MQQDNDVDLSEAISSEQDETQALEKSLSLIKQAIATNNEAELKEICAAFNFADETELSLLDKAQAIQGVIEEKLGSIKLSSMASRMSGFEIIYSRQIGEQIIESENPWVSHEQALAYLAQKHAILNLDCVDLVKTKNEDLLTNAIAEAIANSPYLTSLHIAQNRLDNEGIKIIAQSQSITTLDISGNLISDEGLKELAKNTVLKDLKAEAGINDPTFCIGGYYNQAMRNITDTGAFYIAQSSSITSLNLSGQRLTDTGIKYLANNPHLTSLSLEGCDITDEGAKILAQCSNLLELDIRGESCYDDLRAIEEPDYYGEDLGKITDEGAKAFLNNHSLTALNMVSNLQISDECFEAVQNQITKNKLAYDTSRAIQKNYHWGNQFNFFANYQRQSAKRTFEPDVELIYAHQSSLRK